jgi:GntR family transcriptional repressor for pyruvate dehydrogenase complex
MLKVLPIFLKCQARLCGSSPQVSGSGGRRISIDGLPKLPDDAGMGYEVVPNHDRAARSRPLSSDNVTQLLIQRFQEMIRDGVLTQGSRLPSERDLAAHFGVARSSLRQALKVLEIMGIVIQRVGDGTYLAKDSSAVLAVPMEFLFLLDDTSVQELTELRLLMEPGLARLAAERATVEDIALLRQSVHDLQTSKGDTAKLVAADLLFHRAIFTASKNRAASSVYQTIHRAMAKMILVTSQLVELEHTLSFHKPIMLAIEKRDGKLAAKLMTEHLQDATALLTREQVRHKQDQLYSHVVRTRKPVLSSKGQHRK